MSRTPKTWEPHPAILQLRERRLSLGMTQREVAEVASMTQSMVSEMETGLTQPNLPTMMRYAHAVGMELKVTLSPKGRHDQ